MDWHLDYVTGLKRRNRNVPPLRNHLTTMR
jgi:hypothetical protein